MNQLLLASAAMQIATDPNQFNNYLILGYAVLWLIGLFYVVSLALRQLYLRRDLDVLELILQEDDQDDS